MFIQVSSFSQDILHVVDLYKLLRHQLEHIDVANGRIFNVGGGRGISVSLAELTRLCEEHSGTHIDIGIDLRTRDADVPWYVTDSTRVMSAFDWKPTRTVEDIVEELFAWLIDHRTQLEPILGS